MSLERKHREVFKDDEYEQDAAKAYAPHASQLTPEQFGNFAESIEVFLSENADSCPIVDGMNPPVYKYKPAPPTYFKAVSVLFIVVENDEGEWILLVRFRAS